MDTGTKVAGFVTAEGLNVRSGAGTSFGIAAPSLQKNTAFEGEIAKDINGADWIKLATVNGAAVSGNQYVAAWLTNHQEIDAPPAVPPQPREISTTAHITADGKLSVIVTEPNGYDVVVTVNGDEYKKS